MPPSDEPLLREPEGLPSELRLGLERLRDKRPSPERLAAMAAAVGLTATAGSANAAGTTTAPAPAGGVLASPAAKLLLLGGLVAAGAVALLALRPSAAPSRATNTPPASVLVGSPSGSAAVSEPGAVVRGPGAPARALSPVGAPSAPSASPADGADETEAPVKDTVPAPGVPSSPGDAPLPSHDRVEPLPAHAATVASTAARTPPSRGDARTTGARPGSPVPHAKATEAELLRDARQVLDRNPLVALSLCEEHQRGYPGGGLTQERELIAIAALLRLGQSGSAESRAARFRASFPRSPYLTRLDRLVPP